MNRGSSNDQQRAARTKMLASMRPRFMNRGSNPLSHATSSLRSRFNEAPIHESGKCQLAAYEECWILIASMRPRFMNRGSPAALLHAAT